MINTVLEEYGLKTSFIVAGVVIGLILAAQLKSKTISNSYPLDQNNAQIELLSSFENDRDKINENISVLKATIEAKQKQYTNQSHLTLLNELEDLKKTNGLTKIRGDGVTITLTDGTSLNRGTEGSIHADDLRDVVNVLRSTRPDAISINDNRVILTTSINAIGNVLTVNQSKITSPYVIEVIGDQQLIMASISDYRNYPNLQQRVFSKKVGMLIEKSIGLTIAPYNSNYLINFLHERPE